MGTVNSTCIEVTQYRSLIRITLIWLVLGLSACGVFPPKGNNPIRVPDVSAILRAQSLQDEPGLSFPFRLPVNIVETRCFGLYPWSAGGERHGGIDIIPRHDQTQLETYEVIAPADARVVGIIENTSGYGKKTLAMALMLNQYWYVVISFEAQTDDESDYNVQVNSIDIKVGQQVIKGERLGALVVSNPSSINYPHIHLGLFYKNLEEPLMSVIANYLQKIRSDGTNLPPIDGAGSPWNPRDLGIPTTFYCAYEFSSPRAQAIYRALPKLNVQGEPCLSVCAYRSTGGNCGINKP